VTSVQQAIVMLGHNTVRSLGMAAATLKFLGRGADVYGMTAGGLWMHSYASAELARDLARAAEFPEETQDALYVGALLHDIGKIVLVDFLTSLSAGRYDAKGAEPVGEWEARLTGFTHFGVGERIAEKWRLAPLTTGCIRHHHLADEVPEAYEREVVLVSLADTAARRLGIGVREPEELPEREVLLLERLGLAEDRFREVLETCSDIAGGAETMFSTLGGTR